MLILIFYLGLGDTSAVLWPHTIPRCTLSNPKFDNCLLSAAKAAVPQIAKGIPELGLRPVDPLTGVNITLGSEVGPVVLRVKMDNVTISGPSKVQFQSIKFNEGRSRLEINALYKVLKMTGNFNAYGRILVIPINSRGLFTFEIRDVQSAQHVKIRKSAQERFREKHIGFKVSQLSRVVVNLKDHQHNSYYNLNRIVNDNWKIVSRALIPSMEKSIQRIYADALSPLFSRFTIEELFPKNITDRSP